MIKKIVASFILSMFSIVVFATESCPPTGDNVEWTAQCFEMRNDARHVKATFLSGLKVDKYGATTIMITEPRELVAVDGAGKVIVPEIRHTGDFDYPNAENGIGRFSDIVKNSAGESKEQCGFFRDTNFGIVVPAQFDYCGPFKGEQATVCKGCKSYCTGPDCQDSVMVGGQALVLGMNGKVQETYNLPSMEKLCRPQESLVTGNMGNGEVWIHCVRKINKLGTGLNKER